MSPRWTQAELDLVHDHPEMTAQELTRVLPRRSVDAVECCRIGIQRFLDGLPIDGFLSQAGIRRMEELHPELAGRR